MSIKINYFKLGKKATKIGPKLSEKRAGQGKIHSNVNIHKKRQANIASTPKGIFKFRSNGISPKCDLK